MHFFTPKPGMDLRNLVLSFDRLVDSLQQSNCSPSGYSHPNLHSYSNGWPHSHRHFHSQANINQHSNADSHFHTNTDQYLRSNSYIHPNLNPYTTPTHQHPYAYTHSADPHPHRNPQTRR